MKIENGTKWKTELKQLQFFKEKVLCQDKLSYSTLSQRS